MQNYKFTAAERFLRYVEIDTQSDPESNTYPSTEKQKVLSRLLAEELREMGCSDAEADEFGYVYATIPSNTEKKNVPVLCFCSHVDTSPDVTGANVCPVVHKNYSGEDITLPKDTGQIIKVSEYPNLKDKIGHDIITTDGSTLLGADDKAGVAEIMDAANYLFTHPEVKHGKIRILFTPDEEVGKGVDKVNLKKLGADIGYTLDGGTIGSLENETFSADQVTIEIQGFNIHPGYAKDKMESAIRIAAEIIDSLPKDKLTPDTTEEKEGFIHCVNLSGTTDKAIMKFIIRDFVNEGLKQKEELIKETTDKVLSKFKRSSYKMTITEQYRNMKEVIEKNPFIMSNAVEAINRSGLNPLPGSIRGGTDGSRLTFMGLPCPNLFSAQNAIHSKLEWISIQDMQKAVETIVNLAVIWEERS